MQLLAPSMKESRIRILSRNPDPENHLAKNPTHYSDGLVTTASGGIIKIGNPGMECHEISFLPEAVDHDTAVSISMEKDRYVFTFGPGGLFFDKAVKATLSYRDADLSDINEDDIRVYWLNERKQTWKLIGGIVDKKQKTVTVDLYHFSRYALAAE